MLSPNVVSLRHAEVLRSGGANMLTYWWLNDGLIGLDEIKMGLNDCLIGFNETLIEPNDGLITLNQA